MRTDPILKHVQLTEELWNEKKGLDCRGILNKAEKIRTVKRMRKIIAELRALDLESEMKFIEKINQLT